MNAISLPLTKPLRAYRFAVSALFFMQGLCFSSWASRIPSIQAKMGLGESTLGLVLFSLPVGSLLGLPLAGFLVTRFGSKKIAPFAILFYITLLCAIGFSPSIPLLVISLMLFGVVGNISNIAINTQAVALEAHYGKNIMASFHGLWSLAGFAAGGVGSYMIGKEVSPGNHYLLIAVLVILILFLSLSSLLPDPPKTEKAAPFSLKGKPSLMILGFIAFCSLVCEGAMFDWSGIYFKKVVEAPAHLVGIGFTAFMCSMAGGRFLADSVITKIGFQRTLQGSSVLIAIGLLTAVAFPQLPIAMAGFLLVGLGVSAVVPLIYSEAGRLKDTPPGLALATVSSIGFLGFLAGPPMIGLIAGASSLRISFIVIAAFGMIIFLMSGKHKASQPKDRTNINDTP